VRHPMSAAVATSVGNVALIDTASAEFERIVRRLPADSWDQSTPSQLSVRDLVEHVVVGNRLTALLLARIDRDGARASLAGDQLGDDPITAVVESADLQAQAFAATPLEQLVAGPHGDIPAAAFLRFRLVDLVVHGWDLLRGAGLNETLDRGLVVDVAAVVEPYLDEMITTGAYGAGPSGTLSPDVTPQARLLDWFGRRP
jgi:uncharacterized protein (TIGR03086 family)